MSDKDQKKDHPILNNPHFKLDPKSREHFGMGGSSSVPPENSQRLSVPFAGRGGGPALEVERDLLPINTQEVVRNPKSFDHNNKLKLRPPKGDRHERGRR